MPPPADRQRGAEGMTELELNIVKKWISLGAKLEAGQPDAPATETDTPGTMPAEVQTWTNSAGVSLQAFFVALNGTNVTLRKEDGSQFDYALENLTPESQALARKLASGQ